MPEKQACSSYADMLGRDDLDIIYIASPNMLHCAQAVEALRAGKHVIVEKPAAVTAGEVQEMYEAAKAGGACIDGAERPLAQQPAGNRMVYEHAAFRDCILAHDEEFFERMYRQSLACARILERAAKS